jgi:hypothetical protein
MRNGVSAFAVEPAMPKASAAAASMEVNLNARFMKKPRKKNLAIGRKN